MKAPSVRQFYLYWLPPLLLTTGILVLSGDLGSSTHTLGLVKWLLSWYPFWGADQMDKVHWYLRIGGHIAAYGGLYFFWFRAFLRHIPHRRGAAILWSLSFCLLIALMDESHQALVSSRQGRILDVALDFGAAALAALALSFKKI